MGFGRKLVLGSIVIGIVGFLLNCYLTPEIQISKIKDGWFGRTKLKGIKSIIIIPLLIYVSLPFRRTIDSKRFIGNQ